MGRSTSSSCLKIIACGSDSADRDDPDSSEVSNWFTDLPLLIFHLPFI